MAKRKKPRKGRRRDKGAGNGGRAEAVGGAAAGQRRLAEVPWQTLEIGLCDLVRRSLPVVHFSCPLPKSRQLLDKWLGVARRLLCTNHPDSAGELREVPDRHLPELQSEELEAHPNETPEGGADPPAGETDPNVRWIPLGRELFAGRCGGAGESASTDGMPNARGRRSATLHPEGQGCVHAPADHVRARRGRIVDHIDGNGLNNRRFNLRICTHQQNQANRGPRGGSSQFVGVLRHKDKWEAGIRYRGEYFYLGLFDDEVEAAKARDRKAYELHGQCAYLNFPDDFRAGAIHRLSVGG